MLGYGEKELNRLQSTVVPQLHQLNRKLHFSTKLGSFVYAADAASSSRPRRTVAPHAFVSTVVLCEADLQEAKVVILRLFRMALNVPATTPYINMVCIFASIAKRKSKDL